MSYTGSRGYVMLWAIGCVLVVIGITILVVCVVKKRQNDRNKMEESQNSEAFSEQSFAEKSAAEQSASEQSDDKGNQAEESAGDDVPQQNEEVQTEPKESPVELEQRENPQEGQEAEDLSDLVKDLQMNPKDYEPSFKKEELYLVVDDKVIPIGDVLKLGRNSNCDVVIEDPLVSRYHCKLGKVFGEYVIEDKHSTNGTLLNDRPVPEDQYKKIKSGDKIQIGYTTVFIK